jgi:hypothetical protein
MQPALERTLASDHLVPFRWPSEWTDPALLRLLASSPINCLLLENHQNAIAGAARQSGLTVLEWNAVRAAPLAETNWNSPAPQIAITGLVWPRIKLTSSGRRDQAESGPTGNPWIDSNAWVARLARVRAPGKPLWCCFQLGKDDPAPNEAAYSIAIADTAAAGARWVVNLDEELKKGLAAGSAPAQKAWQSILSTLAFFEKRRNWNAWEPYGSVGILSTFTGDDEFMGQEVLNLAARRNLLYRILDRNRPETHKLEDLRAVLYVDNGAPAATLKNKLVAFARAGGLLIVPHALAAQFTGEKPVHCGVGGYELRSLGKGRLATATRDWDDPYFVAADLHSLVSRRHDLVRLFNAGSLWEHYSVAPDKREGLLQLVGFTSRRNDLVSLTVAHPWRSAAMYMIGSDQPAMLEAVKVEGKLEYRLPPFSFYTALEFRA